MQGVVDAIAGAVLNLYDRLGKKGKVGKGEWTVLAGFVAVSSVWDVPVVLSLGTGTKCLDNEEMDPHRVSDQHAEVVARRALVLALVRRKRRKCLRNLFFWLTMLLQGPWWR